ncbi:Alpha/Beta hydrolase protein [Rhexocercosporidium sp. MPI-PUGE-AT-0058]|nr:Alpha/Beta hydrolase protein [Rhexocercosporidium sp. MPI-PUGE-AT-0058]
MSLSSLPVATSGFLDIPTKSDAPISYTLFPATPSPNTAPHNGLVIFVNGLGLPAASWVPAIASLRMLLGSCPAILTYDRFGQGLTTSRDPLDGQTGKELGHDLQDVANDLHEIILSIATSELGLQKIDAKSGKLPVLLIGASIGAPIARLYAQGHEGIVAGMILLDSNIANINYSDFLPDPDSPNFNGDFLLSDDCTLEQYKEARLEVTRMFDLKVKNPESLDRTNSPVLLPYSHQPKLVGTGQAGPLLSVVGHDPATFADLSFAMMGTPRSLSKITNEFWAEYNEGLTGITDEGKCKGVVIAKGCGHFIQKDSPEFVAQEISDMIKELGW